MAPIEHLISADSHLVEPYDLWTSTLGSKWGDAVPRLVRHDESGSKLFFTGIEYIEVEGGIIDQSSPDAQIRALQKKAAADPDARLKCLDIDKVDFEVLNSTWMLYAMRIQNGELRRDCARVYNDWAAEFAASHPERFIATAMLPVDDVAWACEELERAAGRGLRGAVVFADTSESQPPYRRDHYDPLWQLAVDTKSPIILHIITGNERDPFTLQGEELEEAAGMTISVLAECQPVLANEFIFGRVFDRFPDLRVMLGEYEVAWLPYFLWRLDQLEHDYPEAWGLRGLARPAREYALQRVYHCAIDDPYVLDVIGTVGNDIKLTWGSDFPHVRCTFPRSRQIVSDMLRDLPADVAADIAYRTACELFQIELPQLVGA
jgi:predicted TIM-barrel fold metal-dependent hydrolase